MMKNTFFSRRILSLWIALYAVLAGLTLDNTLPYKGDESFYLASSMHMLQTGNYLTPVYFGEFRFQKPILTYWITLAGYKLFGIHLWSGRILFLGLACALLRLIYKFAFLLLQDQRFALLNVCLLSAATLFIEFSRVSMTDLPLTFFSTLGLYFFCHALKTPEKLGRYYLLAFLSVGLAMSAKSFLGIFPVAAVVAYIMFKRPHPCKRYVLYLFHPVYWSIVLALGGLWYVYIYRRYPADVMNQLGHESSTHVSLTLAPLFGHLLFYAQHIITYYLPFTAVAAFIYFKKRYRFPSQFLPVILHLAITLMVLIFLVHGHKARYLLVIFPQLTLIVSYLLYHHNLGALAKKIALGWMVLQFLFLLGYPMISGTPLKKLIQYWEEQLPGELSSYGLSRKELSWIQALSHGRVDPYQGGNGYVIVEAEHVDEFDQYEVVHQAARLRNVRLKDGKLVREYRTYLLIKPSP